MVKLVATLSSYGRRAVVVGGVADRYAGELARAGQSNRRRAGTGSASPQRATRPPLWPAGMAEGNRETFGPRVGLSSHGSPAKGGPKSKCLARLKIARTSAGPPSLKYGPVPLSAPRAGPLDLPCLFDANWKPVGPNRVLPGRSGVNLAALRTVKLSPALITWLFRKHLHNRQIKRVGFRVSKNTLRRAPPFPSGDARACVITPNCQRPSALSRHTQFTTGMPESCERLRNLVSS